MASSFIEVRRSITPIKARSKSCGFVEARRASTNPHDFDLALMGVMDRRTSMKEEATAPPPSLSGWTR